LLALNLALEGQVLIGNFKFGVWLTGFIGGIRCSYVEDLDLDNNFLKEGGAGCGNRTRDINLEG
jgi:hypothetical protein